MEGSSVHLEAIVVMEPTSPDLEARLNAQDEQLAAIRKAVESTQRYFKWTFWVTIVLFVVPLIGIIFIVPWAFSSYLGSFDTSNSPANTTSQSIQMLQDLLQ